MAEIGPRARERIAREAAEEKEIKRIKSQGPSKSWSQRLKGVFVESKEDYYDRKDFEGKKKKAELESFRSASISEARKAGAARAKAKARGKGMLGSIKSVAGSLAKNASKNTFGGTTRKQPRRMPATDVNFLSGAGSMFGSSGGGKRRAVIGGGSYVDITGMRAQKKKTKKKRTGHRELDDLIFM